jgi:hypothetical protein
MRTIGPSVMSTLDSRPRAASIAREETKMLRKILAVVAGLVVWLTVVMVAGILLRLSWLAYARVADAMTFTLPMLMARLSIAALATLATGVVTAIIVPRSMIVRLMPGLILLLAFIPQHIMLWDRFPIWYHLTFLVSLVPLTFVGGMIWRGKGMRAAQPGARGSHEQDRGRHDADAETARS